MSVLKNILAMIFLLTMPCVLTLSWNSSNYFALTDRQDELEDTDWQYESDLSDSTASEIVVYAGDGESEIGYKQSISLEVRRLIADKKYMRIDLTTDVKILGTIKYCPASDKSDITTEYFYTEPTNDPICQFLDFFRGKGFEDDIVVKSITFDNVSRAGGKINLKEISFSDRTVADSELFLENDYVKVGVDLESGGAIHYFERKGMDVKQVYGSLGYGSIVAGECPDSCAVASENVNLLNNADRGRLLQQSYYGEKYSGEYWNGSEWYYNPVQGGGSGNERSQLVDYRLSETEIYTKCIPEDWATSAPTKSYMENWITLEDGGVVRVHNRYTDFTGKEHNTKTNQEMPALYVPFLFDTFVCYEGSAPFTGGDLFRSSSLGFWGEQIREGFLSNEVTEYWSAWVNGDDFGFGIFVPGLTHVESGRYPGGMMNTHYDKDAFENAMRVYDRDASTLSQTDYSTHEAVFSLPNYGILEYNYFIMADYLKTMRSKFNSLAGTETNDSLMNFISRD